MKVLVTGGAGFLGKYVIKELADQNYNDVVVIRSKDYDLRSCQDTYRMFADHSPDAVIHLAAVVGGIGANKENPGRFFYDNMMMGLNIIEGSRLYNVKKFVQVGTVCSYPKYCAVPFQEKDMWSGYPEETNAPYGVAKKALYVMLGAYKEQYGMNSTIVVPSNLYGPYDNFDPASSHVIPALIKKIHDAQSMGNSKVTVWGSGKATREFLYASDAARAIVLSLSQNTSSDPMNLGGGIEISIKDLTNLIADLMNFKGSIDWDDSKPDGQPRRCVDSTLAHACLGWKAMVSLKDGLQQTISWYREHKG